MNSLHVGPLTKVHCLGVLRSGVASVARPRSNVSLASGAGYPEQLVVPSPQPPVTKNLKGA